MIFAEQKITPNYISFVCVTPGYTRGYYSSTPPEFFCNTSLNPVSSRQTLTVVLFVCYILSNLCQPKVYIQLIFRIYYYCST